MNHEQLFITTIAIIFSGIIALRFVKNFRHTFDVPEGWAGLVYRHGLYVRRNNAGRHTIWGLGWSVRMIDIRKTSFPITGREILTADNIGLKLALLVTCQVTDPAKARHETQNWHSDLHHAAQLAARAVVGGLATEALLGHRLDIATQLLAHVQPEAGRIGIQVHAIRVKDVILPADLKHAFSERLKAKLGVSPGFAPFMQTKSALHAGAEGAD